MYVIYTDGGYRMGTLGWGFVVTDDHAIIPKESTIFGHDSGSVSSPGPWETRGSQGAEALAIAKALESPWAKPGTLIRTDCYGLMVVINRGWRSNKHTGSRIKERLPLNVAEQHIREQLHERGCILEYYPPKGSPFSKMAHNLASRSRPDVISRRKKRRKILKNLKDIPPDAFLWR